MPAVCKVCLDAPITHGFECVLGIHVCVCKECGEACLRNGRGCPLCRADSRLVRCFMDDEDDASAAATPAAPPPPPGRQRPPIPPGASPWDVQLLQHSVVVSPEEVRAAFAAQRQAPEHQPTPPPLAEPAVPAALLHPAPRARDGNKKLTDEEYTVTREALTSLFSAAPESPQRDTNLIRALKRARGNHLIKATQRHHIRTWVFAKMPVSVVQHKTTGVPQLSRGLQIDNYDESEGMVRLRNAAATTVPWEMVFGPKIA